MKQICYSFSFLFLFSAASCHYKMVRSISESKKLEINQKEFIGRPLKVLLKEIRPQIKFAYGNPDNNSSNIVGGTFIKFFFVDRNERISKINRDEKPIGITVQFQLESHNSRKPISREGLTTWGKEQVKEYGDMIITRIFVSGSEEVQAGK